MRCQLFFHKKTTKDVDRLPAEIVERIMRAIFLLAEDPLPHGHKKITSLSNGYRIRIGDYRVIYLLHQKEKAVEVMRIRHRKEIYRNNVVAKPWPRYLFNGLAWRG